MSDFKVTEGEIKTVPFITDIQKAKLWAFLDAEIKHLNGLINGADQEDREIAEAIYKGDIGKDVIM